MAKAKKLWQTPGTAEIAAWQALSTAVPWEVEGGVWTKLVREDRYFVVLLLSGAWEGGTFQGQARWLDLRVLTLPERRRIGGEGIDLVYRAVAQGFGLVLGGVFGNNATTVRAQAKRFTETFDFAEHGRSISVPQVHHLRWGFLREKQPVEYMAGFLLGMRRGDAGPGEPPAFLAGWEHGWEYAVGRVGLPSWFVHAGARGLG